MMLKALPLVHFWSVLLLKEQMMTSVRKTVKTPVGSAQYRSISSKICPENNHKIRRFLPITFRPSLPRKFREIPAKSAVFAAISSLKITQNLTFFFRHLSITSPAYTIFSQRQGFKVPVDLKCSMYHSEMFLQKTVKQIFWTTKPWNSGDPVGFVCQYQASKKNTSISRFVYMANYACLHNSSHHTEPHPIIANDNFNAKLLVPIVEALPG